MAERRMFAKTIIDSDVFLDMPLSTQALYFHLSMRADDDGFINNPKKIMRMIGASQNELEILLAKRYLLSFESGIVVIKHWRIHNYIQKDRYNETKYLEEKATLSVQENRAYTESKKLVSNMDTSCIQNGDTGKVRLDKISKGKDSIDNGFDDFWNVYPKKMSKKKALDSYTKLYKSKSLPDNLIDIVKKWANTEQWKKDNGQFIPLAATWLNQERWNDELPKEPKKQAGGYAPNITDNGLRFEA